MERKIGWTLFIIAFMLVFMMWFVNTLDRLLPLELYQYGVYPLRSSGLIGIITAPFIHSTVDFGHILNNSAPTFVLSWLLFYHYRKVALKSFLIIYFLTGIGVWFVARENYHIGMSGVIYGMASFLVVSGFFKQNIRVAGISLLVIFMYGSIIWGIFPQELSVSWEGHAMGLFSGIIAAVIFRGRTHEAVKYKYEIEEELGLEPDEEYWTEEYAMKRRIEKMQEMNPTIRYEFVPKQVNVEPPKTEEE